ncbi:hypothetical protein M2651_13250 [Clostridium sp. SYSU_GA19001]|uniref:CsxC family protein n=1 Tax=Clostridium caldaquaticum TaxID=2940653 RepID=UPI002077696E|nr:hypothetical protein [Clostridium caldaquaticum]MCM8711966.1 hypothetical protein [Clostridium caldaquaticum]
MNRNCSANETNISPQQTCESSVINPTTLCECDNHCYPPCGRPGPLVVKVPVVLANCKIQIDVESDLQLEQPAFDIKTVDKKVCITQCHLVPYTNKLFIEGYVQKNFQYSTVGCANATSISGDVLHSTLRVPFKCCTAICFDKMPIFGITSKDKSNVLDENMLCLDNREDSWKHFNKPQEPVFCELEWFKILESDIYNRNLQCAQPFTTENCFRRFTEKMVIYVGIKVLQKQQVYIPCPGDGIDPREMEKGYVEEKYDEV